MSLVTAVVLFALLSTAVTLVLGIRSMTRGSATHTHDGTHYMTLRVGWQGITLALMMVSGLLAAV